MDNIKQAVAPYTYLYVFCQKLTQINSVNDFIKSALLPEHAKDFESQYVKNGDVYEQKGNSNNKLKIEEDKVTLTMVVANISSTTIYGIGGKIEIPKELEEIFSGNKDDTDDTDDNNNQGGNGSENEEDISTVSKFLNVWEASTNKSFYVNQKLPLEKTIYFAINGNVIKNGEENAIYAEVVDTNKADVYITKNGIWDCDRLNSLAEIKDIFPSMSNYSINSAKDIMNNSLEVNMFLKMMNETTFEKQGIVFVGTNGLLNGATAKILNKELTLNMSDQVTIKFSLKAQDLSIPEEAKDNEGRFDVKQFIKNYFASSNKSIVNTTTSDNLVEKHKLYLYDDKYQMFLLTERNGVEDRNATEYVKEINGEYIAKYNIEKGIDWEVGMCHKYDFYPSDCVTLSDFVNYVFCEVIFGCEYSDFMQANFVFEDGWYVFSLERDTIDSTVDYIYKFKKVDVNNIILNIDMGGICSSEVQLTIGETMPITIPQQAEDALKVWAKENSISEEQANEFLNDWIASTTKSFTVVFGDDKGSLKINDNVLYLESTTLEYLQYIEIVGVNKINVYKKYKDSKKWEAQRLLTFEEICQNFPIITTVTTEIATFDDLLNFNQGFDQVLAQTESMLLINSDLIFDMENIISLKEVEVVIPDEAKDALNNI